MESEQRYRQIVTKQRYLLVSETCVMWKVKADNAALVSQFIGACVADKEMPDGGQDMNIMAAHIVGDWLHQHLDGVPVDDDPSASVQEIDYEEVVRWVRTRLWSELTNDPYLGPIARKQRSRLRHHLAVYRDPFVQLQTNYRALLSSQQ